MHFYYIMVENEQKPAIAVSVFPFPSIAAAGREGIRSRPAERRRRMLKDERKNRIMAVLERCHFTTVDELSRYLGVSQTTVRRDLDELIAAGRVERNRRGVTLPAENYTEAPVRFRSAVDAGAKAAIGRRAAGLVSAGSVIFLDSSSTGLCMIEPLAKMKNITVVTHSLAVIDGLSNSDVDLYLTGGEYYAPSQAFFGEEAIRAAERFNFDYMFFSCNTVTPDGYATATFEHSAALRRRILARTRCPVLLCCQNKIGRYRAHNIANINDVKYIVTDSPTAFQNVPPQVIRVEEV